MISPPFGLYFTALDSRFAMIRSMRASSQSPTSRPISLWTSMLWRGLMFRYSAARRLAIFTRSAGPRSSSMAWPIRQRVMSRSSSTRRTSWLVLSSIEVRPSTIALAGSVVSRARARWSRLARPMMIVAGVLRSCETAARNSSFWRSRSRSGVMSWNTATPPAAAPAPSLRGALLTRMGTSRPVTSFVTTSCSPRTTSAP
jgi:hypothetical protein